MSAWIEKFIGIDPHTRSGKKLDEVRKLVVHYTANNGGTAMNHYNYFENLKDRYASAHIFVDKKEAICIIPLNEVAFHAGDIQKRNADGTPYRGVKELLPKANYLSIGVEMCLEKDGTFHEDTIKRTEDVFVELCEKFKLDPLEDIVRHFDVTKKNCPAPWVSNKQKFIDFKKRVDAKLNPPKPTEPTTPSDMYRVRKSWDDAKSQIGAYKELENAIDLANKNVGYEVYDSEGKQVYPTTNPKKPKEEPVAPKYPNTLFEVQSPLIKNDHVKKIQQQLNKKAGKTVVKVDSYYGKDTKKEIEVFQGKNGLKKDGVVGKLTWNALFK